MIEFTDVGLLIAQSASPNFPFSEVIEDDAIANAITLIGIYGALTLGSIVTRSAGALLGAFFSTLFICLSLIGLVNLTLVIGVFIVHAILVSATVAYQIR